MSKLSILLFGLILFCFVGNAQDSALQRTKYIITRSVHDDMDLTNFELRRGGELIFEFDNQQLVKFINYSSIDKTSSFGSVYALKVDTLKDKDYPKNYTWTRFKWNFKNDYDSITGTADIDLLLKETVYESRFYLKMVIPKMNSVTEYWGYKEGTKNEYILSETVHKKH